MNPQMEKITRESKPEIMRLSVAILPIYHSRMRRTPREKGFLGAKSKTTGPRKKWSERKPIMLLFGKVQR